MKMSWAGRLRLTFGLVVVFALIAGLMLHLNQSRGTAISTSASIETQTFTIGSAYAGTVVDQLHKVGDHVSEGDVLFAINSPALRRDIASGLVNPASSGQDIRADGTLLITATGNGQVSDLTAERGSFVESGTSLATIDRDASLYVSADLTLSPAAFARLDVGAPTTIVLPNERTLVGRVEQIHVRTSAGQAQVVVTISSRGLVESGAGGIVDPGVPVTANVTLRNDGPVSTAANYLHRQWTSWTRQ